MIADARGDERFLRRRRGARFVNPEADEQIGGEPDQFPADEEKKQAVGDDDAEHGGGEKREVGEEAGEILVVRHVADAENENPKADERDHDQHRGRERIEHPADAQRLVAESEPGEIVEGAPAGVLERGQKGDDSQDQRHELADDGERCGRCAPRRWRGSKSKTEAASGTAGTSQKDAATIQGCHPLS